MVGLSDLLWEVNIDFPRLQRRSKGQAQGSKFETSKFETESCSKYFEGNKGDGPTLYKGKPNSL